MEQLVNYSVIQHFSWYEAIIISRAEQNTSTFAPELSQALPEMAPPRGSRALAHWEQPGLHYYKYSSFSVENNENLIMLLKNKNTLAGSHYITFLG